jgi:ADP-dependent NAD(P)H-hydrate dehydratase / NAD(P)H-hydrate epimerase
MTPEYFLKQTADKALFPEMLWNRPENKMYAGKLLIVGGNLHGFHGPALAYTQSLQAGVGVARVLLPDCLKRTVSKLFPEAEFVPSTPSGSFASRALGEILPAAEWANGVLLAGNFGKNSETTIMLDSFMVKFKGAVTLHEDAIDYAISQAQTLVHREHTALVMDFHDLQKFVKAARYPKAITSDMDFLRFIELLHELSSEWAVHLLIKRDKQVYVAADGQVSSTPCGTSLTARAAHASVWWLQNPAKPFEAFTTSLVEA